LLANNLLIDWLTSFISYLVDYIVFIKRQGIQVNLNLNECKNYQWIGMKDLEHFLQHAKDSEVTPWFKLIADNYLFNWWKSIDTVEKFQDDKIYRLL